MKKNLLVTGASGFLGWNLCSIGSAFWNVFGTCLFHPIARIGATIVSCDLTKYVDVKELFATIRPDAVIHAAALSDPNACQQQPFDSRAINVDAAINLAGLCADARLPFVFTSSDLVFDGRNAPYDELAYVNPLSIYGEHKVLAEDGICARHPGAVICRMPLMFGNPGPAAKTFIQPMIEALKSGREMRLFSDEFRTPVSGTTAAAGLLWAVTNFQGTLHLGGRERISRLNFGRLLCRVIGMEGNLVGVRQADIVMPAPRPADVSLDSRKAFDLGYDPNSLEDELRTVVG